MKLLLYSLNYAPELTGIGKYNGELVPFLVKKGIETHVVTAQPYYPEWQRHRGYRNFWTTHRPERNLYIYRCPLFVPRKLTTVKRILHLISFSVSSAIRLFTLLRVKPDIVLLIQPTLFCAPMAILYCKLTGAKPMMHIQDFEVDAMLGLGLGGEGRVKTIVKRIESWLLDRFQIISSISHSMLENAKSKGVPEKKLLFFPNWTDTDFISSEKTGDTLRAEWGYSKDEKIILYSGNIGVKQGLEIILEAAEQLSSKKNVKFLIVGSGAYGQQLKDKAAERGLINIDFKPLQPWSLMPEILTMADVHLVVQKRGAADAVLPSKLTNILSAGGHALVTADTDTELGQIALSHPGIYTCVIPENISCFIDGLNKVLSYDTQTVNTIARQFAVENININRVISRFILDIS